MTRRRFALPATIFKAGSLCLALALGAQVRAEPVLSITENEDHFNLSNIQQYTIDESATATLDDMRKDHKRFVVSHNDTINAGFTKAALWTKLNIHNDTDTDQDLLLVVSQSLLLDVTAYEVTEKQHEQQHEQAAVEPSSTAPDLAVEASAGDTAVPTAGATERKLPENADVRSAKFGLLHVNTGNAVQSRFPNYGITLKAGETRTVYFRSTASNVVFPLTVWKKQAFIRDDHFSQYISGYYYGMLTLVGIYNFLMFFIVKEKSHLFYVAFLVSFICAMSIIEGFFMEHAGPFISHNAVMILYFFDCALVVSLCLYMVYFLDMHILYPQWSKKLLLASAIVPVTMIIPFFTGLHGFDMFHTALVSVLCCIVLGMGGYLLVKGNYWARYFMAAWSILLFGALVYVLTVFGVLPHNHLTATAIQIGSVAEAILQSLGLAAKMANLKRESLLAQQAVENMKKEADVQMKTFTQLLRFATMNKENAE